MSIVVTPQPDNVPPRVRIDIDSDDPTKPFTSLAVYRDGKPLREQPYVGGSEAVVFDYEAPFGVSVTYSVTGEISSSPTSVYTTAWASLTGWSTVTGTPTVSGGRLTAGRVSRPVALPTRGVLTLDAPFGGSQFSLPFLELGSFLKVTRNDGVSVAVRFGAVTKTIGWTSGALKVQWDGAGAVIVADGASTQVTTPLTNSDPTIYAAATGGTAPSVAGFSIVDQGAPTPFSASASTTLDTTQAWLIHPSQPSLSCAIDSGPQGAHNLRFIEASSGETKSSEAQRTIHRGIGSRRAVVITSGPRTADEWTLILGAPTIQQKNAVRAIVDDQTPLLLRIPPAAQYDLPDDWYSVGDLTVTRLETPNITEETSITLPLTPVDEPIVRQGALWTYGSDLLLNATYADSRAAFPTYLDRLAGAS